MRSSFSANDRWAFSMMRCIDALTVGAPNCSHARWSSPAA